MSEETQLADLLVLNLHNFEDEVGTLLGIKTFSMLLVLLSLMVVLTLWLVWESYVVRIEETTVSLNKG